MEAELVEHNCIDHLASGFLINDPNRNVSYTIQEPLGKGGEGYSYVALDPDGNQKVVKIITPSASSTTLNLEEKLRGEFRVINRALGTNYTSFPVNPLDIAVVGDFVNGLNLEQEVIQTDRAFTQSEAAECMLQLLKGYVKPLHDEGIVHRDIKPQNIICTHNEDGSVKYTLIDFGNIRQNNGLATITLTMKGTPGYSRIKGQYEFSDDFYSLAKTAYFLITGRHPEFVGAEKYDELNDGEKFSALRVDDKFRKVLFKMLGHEKKKAYTSADDLIRDLEKARNEKAELELDLSSAKALTLYRESSVMPESLQRRINGIKARFVEEYKGAVAKCHRLSDEYLRDLEEVLMELGYKRMVRGVFTKPFFPRSGEYVELPVYERSGKESSKREILSVDNGIISRNYFRFFTLKEETDLEPYLISDTNIFLSYFKWYKTDLKALDAAFKPAPYFVYQKS